MPPSLARKSDVSLQTSLPSSYSITMDVNPLLECFLYHPEPTDIVIPLDYTLLRQQQFDDLTLQQAHLNHPAKYPIHDFGDVQLICYTPNPTDSWKIAISTQALDNII